MPTTSLRFSDTARRRGLPAAALLLTTSLLSACGSAGPTSAGTSSSATAVTTSPGAQATPTEERRAVPRLAATYEGGLLVLDAATLDIVADLPLAGFNRVSAAGDGRHLAVSTAGGFAFLDAGTWAEPHGDHAHHFTQNPALGPVSIPAKKPGHVVVHDGRTTFFDDGTGTITVVDSATVAARESARKEISSQAPHHGVAVTLADGSVVRTLGDEKLRTGVLAQDADGKEIARIESCPGVHGEAAAQGGALVFGCENGAVLYSGRDFRKVNAPDPYGRIGNQKGSDLSPITLGDYKTDKAATLERPKRISLIDTRTGGLRFVDLPASYSFRSLARGPRGEALVLGTDGKLHIIDPERAVITESIAAVNPWSEPEDWHDARPTLFVQGNTAYVTEPSTRRIVSVDLLSRTVAREATLPHATDEISGVSGELPR